MRQTRVAGTKVVQRQLAAHFPEFVGYLACVLQVVGQSTLGDLYGQPSKREPVVLGCLVELARQAGILQLNGRNIDCQRKRLRQRGRSEERFGENLMGWPATQP